MQRYRDINSLSLLLFVFSFCFSSCQKAPGWESKPRSELVVGTWLLISDHYDPAYDADKNGIKDTETLPLYPACKKDDLITIKPGGTGVFEQGSLVCRVNDPTTSPFSWSLYNNDYTLELAGESYALMELTDKVMKIASTFQEAEITYKHTYTFTRK